jgi:hypothetical protein
MFMWQFLAHAYGAILIIRLSIVCRVRVRLSCPSCGLVFHLSASEKQQNAYEHKYNANETS